MARPDLNVFFNTETATAAASSHRTGFTRVRYNMNMTVFLHDNQIYRPDQDAASADLAEVL